MDAVPLPPVQNLSDDVLYIIFETAYLHDFPRCRLHSGLLEDSPVVVTHVCRRWRRLALDLPALWSCIHITPDQGTRYLHAVDAFLERSRNRELSILLVSHSKAADRGWGSPPSTADLGLEDLQARWPRYMACLASLVQHGRRWKNCGFFLGHVWQLKYLFQALSKNSYPALQFFQAFVAPPARAFYVASGQPPLPIAPNLQELRINFACSLALLKQYALTGLMLDRHLITTPQLVNILTNLSPTLTRLILRNVTIEGSRTLPSRPRLSLPHLRSLTIASLTYGDHDAKRIVNELLHSCPDLESFQITKIDSLEAIISQDSSIRFNRVHSLFIHLGPESDAFFWSRYIAIFPAVQDLYIRMFHASSCLTEAWSATTDDHVIWPDLRSFTITVHRPSHLSEVFAFLKHRAHIQLPIHSVTLMCFTCEHLRFKQHWESECSAASLPIEVQWQPIPPYDPFDPWDSDKNAPSFTPWKALLTVEDQDL